MRKRVAMKINDTVIIFYIALEKHFLRFITLDNSYFEFLKRFFALESALDYALQLDPENHKLVRNGLDLCQRVGPKQISKNISGSFSIDFNWRLFCISFCRDQFKIKFLVN